MRKHVVRTPVLQNCQFFVASVCGYCGFLILGGSAKELRDEEDQHAIECKATHDSVGVGGIEGLRAECRFHQGTYVLSGIWLHFTGLRGG
jgi:hypothetical protein